MIPVNVPTKEQVPEGSRKYFDYFIEKLGSMPNLYAVMAYSEPSISSYIQMQKRQRLLTRREYEVVCLVVSAMHNAKYCLETHTMIAKLNGLDDGQITEVKGGTAGFDQRLNVLAILVHNILLNKTRVDEEVVDDFFKEGYSLLHLLDVAMAIADNVISNIVSNAMHVPVDL